jgi:F0F1-type ATP synthase epsilon subunit
VNLLPPRRPQIDQVVLPGVEGYFGVKANHVPYIAQLKPGVVELHDGARRRQRWWQGLHELGLGMQL